MQLFRSIETTACHVLDPHKRQMPSGLTIQEIRQVDLLPHGTSLHVRNGSVHLCQRPGIDAVPACILVRATAGRHPRFPGAISPSVMASMMRTFPFLQHLPC